MPCGLSWNEAFIQQFADKEFRNEFVADQIRMRIALLIRALREQPDRGWSQAYLGSEMGKPQSAISRIEDPDYGKLSLQTLLEVVAAFDLPLWVDIPEWEDWFDQISDVPNSKTFRRSFDARRLSAHARVPKECSTRGTSKRNYNENIWGEQNPLSAQWLMFPVPNTKTASSPTSRHEPLRLVRIQQSPTANDSWPSDAGMAV
jgi:hypothetical protein